MPEAAQGQLHTRVHDDVVGHAPPGVEDPSIPLRPVLLTGLSIVVFVGASLVGLHYFYRSEVTGPLLTAPRTFPPPRLQQNPEGDLAAMLKVQRDRLNGYAWIDRDAGVARMPIAEAMARLAERGQAAYAAPVQPERVPTLGSRGGATSDRLSPDATSDRQQPGSVNAPAGAQNGPGTP